MYNFNIQYKTINDLQKAKERLPSIPPTRLLIQVFCGEPSEQYIQTLLAEITRIFPGVQILGTTTAGEIMDGESFDKTTVINFTQFENTEVRTALADENEDLYSTGLQLGEAVYQPGIKLAIVFGCGIKEGGAVNGEPLLAGFQKSCPRVMIAGGQAGDNGVAQKTFVFTQDGYTDKGAAAASLSGDCLNVNNHYNLSWAPLGKKMIITNATGTSIHTIDNRPAKDIYAHYLGENVGGRLPHSAAEFPLVVERSGVHLARHANRLLPDGSLEFMAPFYTGERVRFAFCHSGLVTESARSTFDQFRKRQNDVIFIYSCLSRKWVLGEDSKLELAPLANLAPTAGFFCYGEYYHNNGENMFLSQTMTILALSEKVAGQNSDTQSGETPQFLKYETKQVQDLQALHRLVETSAEEREALIKELQSALAEIKTLRGFIPICAKCKSIRDDKGFWNQIEQYIQQHTQAQFSHGLCPGCAADLYPEIFDNDGQLIKEKEDQPL
ncbi:MAG: FIST N-terminal domain-containing protein [Desulforhopalus sp.]